MQPSVQLPPLLSQPTCVRNGDPEMMPTSCGGVQATLIFLFSVS